MNGHVVALCGGVGGAKLADGLQRVLPPGALTVIVNTGDDFEHLGLKVSPDIDSVVYALAGLSDPERGWGRREESWAFMRALAGLGGENWFQLGDADLAMHVLRSAALARGQTLAQFTGDVCRALGVGARVVPMSDAPVRTQLLTDDGWLEFQEYFVRRRCEPRIRQLRYAGAERAAAHPDALAALARPDLSAVVICPSNPFVSIAPILALPALRVALGQARAPVLAVSPIVGGRALKGPADKMLVELGLEVSPASVAACYRGLVHIFVSDLADSLPRVPPGMVAQRAATVMRTPADRDALARALLALADRAT